LHSGAKVILIVQYLLLMGLSAFFMPFIKDFLLFLVTLDFEKGRNHSDRFDSDSFCHESFFYFQDQPEFTPGSIQVLYAPKFRACC